MLATAAPPRYRLPTIFSIYQPLEEYWKTWGPMSQFGPELARVFPPLDAFLIHLILAQLPDVSVLIDLAVESTGAASSVLGLLHPRIQTVMAGSWSTTASSDQTFAALEEYRLHHNLSASLEIRSAAELLANISCPPGTVVLVDARTLEPNELANAATRWCDSQADVFVLLLGLGVIGACPALPAILRVCPVGGARRFWLARELDEALSASTLGILAPASHPSVAEILFRIQQLYTTNHQFLHLLRDANQRALEAARLDDEIMKSHPSAWPLHNELQEWKRHTNEAREQAEQARRQLVEARQATNAIAQHRDAIQQNMDAIQQSLAYRLARRVSHCRGWLYQMLRRIGRACRRG